MKKLLLVLLAACGGPGLTPRTQPAATATAVPGSPTAAPPDPKLTYEDPEAQFSVRFPLPFEVDRSSEALGGGTMVTTSLSTVADDPLYMAVRVNLENISAYNCEKGLDGMRDQTMKRVGCKVLDEKRFDLKGNPSRDVSFTCPNRKGVMLLSCDASKSAAKRYTAYEIVASGATMTEENARRFLSSFTLK